MTKYQPLWQQAGSYAASVDRGLLGSLWPAGGTTGAAVAAVANTMQVQAQPGTVAVPMQAPVDAGGVAPGLLPERLVLGHGVTSERAPVCRPA